MSNNQSGLLSLTRQQHDELLDRHPRLLNNLLKSAASREWSLSGVLLYGVSQDMIANVIDAMVSK